MEVIKFSKSAFKVKVNLKYEEFFKQCINPYLMNCTTGANEMWIVGKGGANCLSNPAHSNRIYIIRLSEILWVTLQ